MKRILLSIVGAGLLVLGMAACQSSTPNVSTPTTPKVPTVDKPSVPTVTYTCEMCGGSYSEAGKCSKCGMPLIPKK